MSTIELLKGSNPEPTFEEAHEASVRTTQAVAMKADPRLERKAGAPEGSCRNPAGKNQHSKAEEDNSYRDKSYPQPRTNRGGTSSEYLAQRIAETAPDIHQRMLAGEYKSTRSAAIDAGIIRPRHTVMVINSIWPCNCWAVIRGLVLVTPSILVLVISM